MDALSHLRDSVHIVIIVTKWINARYTLLFSFDVLLGHSHSQGHLHYSESFAHFFSYAFSTKFKRKIVQAVHHHFRSKSLATNTHMFLQ